MNVDLSTGMVTTLKMNESMEMNNCHASYNLLDIRGSEIIVTRSNFNSPNSIVCDSYFINFMFKVRIDLEKDQSLNNLKPIKLGMPNGKPSS